MQLEVEFNDETKKDIKVIMADMVKFESEYNISIAKLGQDMKVTHLLWLASIGAVDPKASKG
jgi:hypothetical protein